MDTLNNKPSSKIQLSLPANKNELDVVRYALNGLAKQMGFAPDEIEDMKLAVGEACNNAALHAYPQGTEGRIEVIFEAIAKGLRIRIRDEGKSFDAKSMLEKTAPAAGETLDEVNPGGLGLFLMKQLLDEVQIYSAKGTEVVLTKFKRSVSNNRKAAPHPPGGVFYG